jgi:beta-galactosidase GanA
MDSQFTYIYEDGLYYLLYTATYPTEPREDLWIEWPEMIGCAEDFQTIADSAIEHMCFYSPQYYEKVREIYLIRCEGDMVYGRGPQGLIFPEGTEVTAYYGPEPTYVETTLDWQSQTRIDK